VGSDSERLVSSDVGKRHCDCDSGVLSFRKSEAEQEKLESAALIGDRIRDIHEAKKLSQCILEKRTGLIRCYISLVENGHALPSVETLEKLARGLNEER
jgi:ribosome-binding protein aMBF1 (putative translation factor)